MKKIWTRILSLLFVCTLALPMAVDASARIISWTDEEGGKTLSVTMEGWDGWCVPFPGAQTVYHTEGDSGDFCSYSGDYDVTLEASYNCPLAYEPYLRQALDGDGQTLSRRMTGNMMNNFFEVYCDGPSGYYCVGAIVSCNYGRWTVAEDIVIGGELTRAASVTSGRVNYVPWDAAEDSGLDNFYFAAVPYDID